MHTCVHMSCAQKCLPGINLMLAVITGSLESKLFRKSYKGKSSMSASFSVPDQLDVLDQSVRRKVIPDHARSGGWAQTSNENSSLRNFARLALVFFLKIAEVFSICQIHLTSDVVIK
jgi:hypothetical protein